MFRSCIRNSTYLHERRQTMPIATLDQITSVHVQQIHLAAVVSVCTQDAPKVLCGLRFDIEA